MQKALHDRDELVERRRHTEQKPNQAELTTRRHQSPGGIPSRPRNGGLMTTCTQPGCTGTIVDDYCDVCGNPAGTPVSVPAAAAAVGSSTSNGRPGPTPVPQTIACRQPGCTGTIVDSYCDVCGSPASTPVSAPAEVAAAAASAPNGRPGPTPVPQTIACRQPGCTGTIVDSYCDVCGSPASTPDSVSAKAAAAPKKAVPAPPPAKTAAAPAHAHTDKDSGGSS